MGHRSFHTFEDLNNHLRLTVDHAAAIYPEPDDGRGTYRCQNRYPENRLFVVIACHGDGGDVTHVESGAATPLLPDSLLLLPGNETYAFRFEPSLELVAVHFRLEVPGGLDLFHDRRSIELRPSGWRAAGEALRQTLTAGQTVAHLAAGRGAVLQLAAAFLPTDLSTLRDWIRSQSTYRPLLDLVDQQATGRPKVTDAARVMGMTADTLSRRFRQDTGITLKAYLDRQLYQKATPALLYTDRSVKQIAADLGFTSAFYFSRFFKKHAGMSPTDFRQQERAYGQA